MLLGRNILKLWITLVNTCTVSRIASSGCLWLLSRWTITGPVITCTVETSVVFVRELGLILCFLPTLSAIFAFFVRSSVDIFASFLWLPAIQLLGRGLHWNVALSLAFKAVGKLWTIFLQVNWLSASKAKSTIRCTRCGCSSLFSAVLHSLTIG